MKIHVVKQGDTLYDLARKYGVDLQTLIDMNPHIKDPNVIQIGDKIKIPSKPQMIGKMANSAKEKLLETKIKPLAKKLTLQEEKKPEKKVEVKPEAKSKPVPEVKFKPAEAKPELPKQLSVAIKPELAKTKPEAKTPFAQYHTPAKPVSSFYDLPEIPGMENVGKGSAPYGYSPNMNQQAFHPNPHHQVGYGGQMMPQGQMIPQGHMMPYGPFTGNMPPQPGMMTHEHATYPLPPYPMMHSDIPGWWQNPAWGPSGTVPYSEVPKQDASLTVKGDRGLESGHDQDDEDISATIKSTTKRTKSKRKSSRPKTSKKRIKSRSRNPWINL